MTKILYIITPFIISWVLQFGPSLSIADKNEAENTKIRLLKFVYAILNAAVSFSIVTLDAMLDNDIFNIFGGRSTYDIVFFLSGIQVNVWTLSFWLAGISMITPFLFFIAGLIENPKEKRQLLIDTAGRAGMFLVGASVAWISIIILLKTPVEMLVDSPSVRAMEYVLILSCLFINFRFQIKADRKSEINPRIPGCVAMCCSAIWCAFVYSAFSIAFLFSFSTFRHINEFIDKEKTYFFLGIDGRILLLMFSILYVVLFFATTKGKGDFRNKYSVVFAAYALAAGVLFLLPLLDAMGNYVVVIAFVVLVIGFILFYFKSQKQIREQITENISPAKKGKPDWWARATLGISLLVVAATAVHPFVRLP